MAWLVVLEAREICRANTRGESEGSGSTHASHADVYRQLGAIERAWIKPSCPPSRSGPLGRPFTRAWPSTNQGTRGPATSPHCMKGLEEGLLRP